MICIKQGNLSAFSFILFCATFSRTIVTGQVACLQFSWQQVDTLKSFVKEIVKRNDDFAPQLGTIRTRRDSLSLSHTHTCAHARTNFWVSHSTWCGLSPPLCSTKLAHRAAFRPYSNFLSSGNVRARKYSDRDTWILSRCRFDRQKLGRK
jgi:hypothetical protein